MTMPNFLIIGAAKSGTSALYHYLRQHPQVYMSPQKETHFFAFEHRDPSTNGPGDTIRTAITDISDYHKMFDGVIDEIAVGEASPTYLYIPRAANRIQFHVPSAKMIVILRNPVDRAYSAYMHLIRDDREPIHDFERALQEEDRRIQENWGPIWHYTKMGLYYTQIKRYFGLFDRQQIRVYLHDDFSREPIAILQDIFQFIQVDDQWIPDISVKPNVSGVPKSQFAHQVMHSLFLKPNPIRAISRALIPFDVRWRITTQLRNRNLSKSGAPTALRAQLIHTFQDDIEKLADLLQRDLSHWYSL